MHLWVQHVVHKKLVRMVKIDGTENPSDIGTKGVERTTFDAAMNRLNILDDAEAVERAKADSTFSVLHF